MAGQRQLSQIRAGKDDTLPEGGQATKDLSLLGVLEPPVLVYDRLTERKLLQSINTHLSQLFHQRRLLRNLQRSERRAWKLVVPMTVG